MKEATLEELDIPQKLLDVLTFTPQYYAEDIFDGDISCAYLYENEPTYNSKLGRWFNGGNWYELGVDDTEDKRYTPDIAKNVAAEDSLIKIIY